MILPWHETLWNDIAGRREKLPHALLLHGQRGTGKAAFAKLLANALLCESPSFEGKACGKCLACGWMNSGTHPDFHLVQPETDDAEAATAEPAGDEKEKEKKQKHITILQVRELISSVSLSAGRGGMRVVVVRPAETMNVNAANALLKTLEEPPPRTLFILVSHQPQKLPPTVRSRCLKIAMPMPTREQAIQWLKEQGVSEPEICLAQAGFAPLLALELNEPEYREKRLAFLDQIADTQRNDPLALAERVEKEKTELAWILNWLQTWVYDLESARMAGAVRYHPDFFDKISQLANIPEVSKLLEYQHELTKARRAVNHPLNMRLVLEQLLLSYWQTMKRRPHHG
ncbi:MAG: DNA polymerase III subunit delta' [Sulfuricella sp.]|nr:DNA polymerase III subunit delta' [Sulfuricella sp.]